MSGCAVEICVSKQSVEGQSQWWSLSCSNSSNASSRKSTACQDVRYNHKCEEQV
jgi:hypothetical protein